MRNAIIAAILALSVAGGITAHQLTTPTPSSSGCGVELWPKKTGSDGGAGSIDLTRSTWASVHSMQQFAAPSPLTSSRAVPVETTVYRMTVTLVQLKQEADSDVHLVIQGGSGRHMIAEIPSPSCVSASSPFLPGITAARDALEARITPTGSWQAPNVPVTVTGVGFFDFKHGQAGVAPNAVELHPVLSIRFLANTPSVSVRGRALPFPDRPGGAD